MARLQRAVLDLVAGLHGLVLDLVTGLHRLVLHLVTGLRGTVVHGVTGLRGAAAQLHGHRARLVPEVCRTGPRATLHVHLPCQLLYGVAEFAAGALDLAPQLVGSLGPRHGGLAARPVRHRCALSLISSTSALTLPRASSGVGGVARRS